MIEAFSAVVPVFLLIGLGVCLDLFRALPENANQTLSLYVLNVALPLLLFQIMATAPLESFAHPQFWLASSPRSSSSTGSVTRPTASWPATTARRRP